VQLIVAAFVSATYEVGEWDEDTRGTVVATAAELRSSCPARLVLVGAAPLPH
jgi:hypothetical protein